VCIQVKDTFEATPPLFLLKTIKPFDIAAMQDLLLRTDVGVMSTSVFGQDYAAVKAIIYPKPKYRSFLIKKRSGGARRIDEPRLPVKNLQLKALELLTKHAAGVKPCVHGFVDGRSILTNAKVHCQRKANFVLNLDLEDFFPSITFYRVRGALQKPPFNYSYEVATVISHLCTHQGRLPQGAPTSPFLSNLISRTLDGELTALARRHRCTYTRYADDITFSFSVRRALNLPTSICEFDGGVVTLGEELRAIIGKQSFRINEKKTRISSRSTRQVVTGLTINQFPNVTRRFVDAVRGALNAWKSHGFAAAQLNWELRILDSSNKPLQERIWKRQTRTTTPPSLPNYLWGKLLFIRMVRGEIAPLYNRLAERYNELVALEKKLSSDFSAPMLPIHFAVQTIAQAAKALYVIEWSGDAQIPGKQAGETEMVGGQGTAFAYKYCDMLITCEHVFRCELGSGMVAWEDVNGAALKITNVKTGVELTATLLHKDMDRDLAVLRLHHSAPNMRHFTRAPDSAIATHQALLLGFPNWTKGKGENIAHTTVATVFPKGALQRFEINTMIRKGNSGGPVTTNDLGLWGVAQEGASQSDGNNQCLCVSELDF
jgi:RNA-directed DNA polymerase